MLSQTFNTTDKLIRSALLEELNNTYDPQEKTTAIIPEFSLVNESARIDIAVVNGILHGYELKSDKDTLLRLNNQKEAYNTVFDEITLVVGKNHLISSIYCIPDWWGITVAKVDKRNVLYFLKIRESKPNPQQNLRAMINLLWKEEIIVKLLQLGISKGVANKSKQYISDLLVNSLNPEDIKSYVRQSLKDRFFNSDWRSDAALM